MKTVKFSFWKKVKIITSIFVISILIALVIGEVFLAIFNPQPHLYPRLSYSEKYRKIPYKNVVIEQYSAPHRRYYSTNEYHLRGKITPISNTYDQPNIVVLGDSHTFGMGVNDGNEWASIMSDRLKKQYNVVNLGVQGWGLTQQIRFFYEFGQLYQPEKVVILFCRNDPSDNLRDNCTTIEDGKFVFKNFKTDGNKIYYLNKLLANSIIQKSNLYRLLSSIPWQITQQKQIDNTLEEKGEMNSDQAIQPSERLYNDLINLFAEDLKAKGIELYFASVNSYEEEEDRVFTQLDNFPYIKKNIIRLDSLGIFDYVNFDTTFSKENMKVSPVDHYDVEWNLNLGTELAAYILNK